MAMKDVLVEVGAMSASGLIVVTGSWFLITKVLSPAPHAAPATAEAHADGEAAPAGEKGEHSESETQGDHETKKGEGAEGKGKSGNSVAYALKTMVVNLAAGSSEHRFGKVTLTLEVKDEASVEKLKTNEAQVYDALIKVLGSYRYEDIATVEGKEIVKQDIKSRLNAVVPGGGVNNVFLTEFLVQ